MVKIGNVHCTELGKSAFPGLLQNIYLSNNFCQKYLCGLSNFFPWKVSLSGMKFQLFTEVLYLTAESLFLAVSIYFKQKSEFLWEKKAQFSDQL